MKIFISFLIVFLVLFSPSAFAQIGWDNYNNPTIGDYKSGAYPLYSQDSSNYRFNIFPNNPVPNGFGYNFQKRTTCLYPVISPQYYGSFHNATSSSAIPDSFVLDGNYEDIYTFSSSPNSTAYYKHLSPCIPGYVYDLVPSDKAADSDSCAILHPEGGGLLETAANVLSSVLPRTPEQFRIPTILSNLGGQGSLAGNLALELYSGIWQYILIIASIKFYQLIPGKFT